MAGHGPALALLEIDSIARGFLTADVLVKRAAVSLLHAEATTPGKFLLLFAGGVAEVEESFKAGSELAGTHLLDKLFLPRAASGLMQALEGQFHDDWEGSLGIVETQTAAAALLAADTALKRAEVKLRALHVARGIGGKGYFLLTGPLHMIEAAIAAAVSVLEPTLLVSTETVENPHRDFIEQLRTSARLRERPL